MWYPREGPKDVKAAAASAGTVANGSPGASTRYGAALTVLATVFFMWGFASVLNDTLVPHLKAVFALNYGQSLLIQFVFFLAYLLMSLPGAKLLGEVLPLQPLHRQVRQRRGLVAHLEDHRVLPPPIATRVSRNLRGFSPGKGGNNHHEYDQQYEKNIDQGRDVDLALHLAANYIIHRHGGTSFDTCGGASAFDVGEPSA